jgi:hypothetical protein
MVVDMPGRTLAEHRDASVVLYYAFSLLAQYAAVDDALSRFRASGEVPGGAEAFERFMDYRAFAERARRYRPE